MKKEQLDKIRKRFVMLKDRNKAASAYIGALVEGLEALESKQLDTSQKYILTAKGERILVSAINRVKIDDSIKKIHYITKMYVGDPFLNVHEKHFRTEQEMNNFLKKYFPTEDDYENK